MTIYHERNYSAHRAEFYSALELLQAIDYDKLLKTEHFHERSDEREVNLKKITKRKFEQGALFEIKMEDEQIVSLGVKVKYNKKKWACLIIGFKYSEPNIVTVWFDKEKGE